MGKVSENCRNTKKIDYILSCFFKQNAAAGIVLFCAALLAIIIANSPLSELYNHLIDMPLSIQIGSLKIAKPLLLWVNDGLMAVFFFMVGLELKREFIEGELSDPKNIALPAFAALGGFCIPALLYFLINNGDRAAMQGWAIPTATDIAFSLGVLSLLGSRVPLALKLLLTSIAIFDDIGAIIVIALFYTSKLSLSMFGIAVFCCAVLFIINMYGCTKKSIYIFIGIIMWVALLKSGIHATLGGIVLALFIPMEDKNFPNRSPVKMLENDLHSSVTFFILPVFAFCNAGINFSGVNVNHFLHPVPLGVAVGLFLGKQMGVFSFCWLLIKTRIAKMPEGVSWIHIYGVSALCGIGFTMSLFIGSLAFEETGVNHLFDERIGIIIGSLLSGLLGYAVLRYSAKRLH